MHLKTCLLTGVFLFALAGVPEGGGLRAQDLYQDAAPIVLAQNDKSGFFGRIFNKSGDRSGAKPLFLRKSDGKTRAGPTPVAPKPYDFQTQSRSGSLAKYQAESKKQWKEYQDNMAREVAATTELSRQAGEAANLRTQKALDAMRERQAQRAGGKPAAGSSGKKAVYDPQKVYQYKAKKPPAAQPAPDQEEQPPSRSRIYNTR